MLRDCGQCFSDSKLPESQTHTNKDTQIQPNSDIHTDTGRQT